MIRRLATSSYPPYLGDSGSNVFYRKFRNSKDPSLQKIEMRCVLQSHWFDINLKIRFVINWSCLAFSLDVTRDMWHATYDIWHMTYVIWSMTYDIWHNGVESAENAVSLLLTTTPTQQQNFIPFLLIYSHELLPADWLKWWLLIDAWVVKTYHLRSFIIFLGDLWSYSLLIFSFWLLDSSRYIDPRHITNYNLPYLTEIYKTVRLWIKTVITDHAMGLYFSYIKKIPQPHWSTGHVAYFNILTWLRGLQDKLLYLLFSLYPSLFWELRDKRN